jgi:integrase
MPKVNPKALLELDEVRAAFTTAKATGPLEGALFAWMYEFGARAAEPGLQKVSDVDLHSMRARVLHLKSSRSVVRGSVQGTEWDAILPFCREVLPGWLEARPKAILVAGQRPYLFPSRAPGDCPACKGSGERPAMRERVWTTAPCHHCGGTGKRWGLSRHEVYHLITGILTRAGVQPGHRHPHTLRHSIITHLLEGEVAAGVIQERVGHRYLQTTLSYARATKTARAKLEGALQGLYNKEKA